MGSPSSSPEPCAQHVHGLQGSSYWISSCLILSRVEASTKPGVIQLWSTFVSSSARPDIAPCCQAAESVSSNRHRSLEKRTDLFRGLAWPQVTAMAGSRKYSDLESSKAANGYV